MKHSDNIFVAGHRGMVGSAIVRQLQNQGYKNIITRTRQELDLLDQKEVEKFFKNHQIDYLFIASAKVGGIEANRSKPAEFIYENLQIQNNLIHQAYLNKVKRLLFLGSSCIYPKFSPQPIKEEYLLTGELEPTNYAYAIAKIAGLKMCQAYREQYGCDFVAVMPTNLYGINDNFDLTTSHVLPALMRKFHEAKINNAQSVEVWGSGKPRREFLYVDDLANACLFVMNNHNIKELVNIGSGVDIAIFDLAHLLKKIIGFNGEIKFNQSMPDGTMQKLLDVSKLRNFGWKAETDLETGISRVYEWYVKNKINN
ncbi:GDP-L-fucose synthase [Alphaproteobacteria bacterium]|nr:GDP-L-fucose synthase [Alphaproteobacteria bacterium]